MERPGAENVLTPGVYCRKRRNSEDAAVHFGKRNCRKEEIERMSHFICFFVGSRIAVAKILLRPRRNESFPGRNSDLIATRKLQTPTGGREMALKFPPANAKIQFRPRKNGIRSYGQNHVIPL